MPPRPVAVAAVLIGLVAAGCGDSAPSSGAGEVKTTVTTALADVARGDGHAFCALTTPRVRAQLGDLVHGDDCAAFIHHLGTHMSRKHRLGLLHAVVRRVTVHGASATVASADIVASRGTLHGWLDDGGAPTDLQRASGGRWLIGG